VEKGRILDGHTIAEGDVVIGLKSDGLHTNGYSLARKIVRDVCKKKYSDTFADTGRTFGEELLRPHVSYTPVRGLMDQGLIKGCAHITGGGFPDNVNRILPKTVDAVIETKRWQPEPIFQFLRTNGNVEPFEAYRTFNMGIGMVLVVDPKDVDRVSGAAEVRRFAPVVVGRVVKGSGLVQMEF
jgi:phosphoribosylformylglycinamidine cyclo-ligase